MHVIIVLHYHKKSSYNADSLVLVLHYLYIFTLSLTEQQYLSLDNPPKYFNITKTNI